MRWPLICSTLSILAVGVVAFADDGDSRPPAFITAPYPTILLSANDGECRFQQTFSGLRQLPVTDSITVVRLGPDHPPRSMTVFGTVPVTIHGSPHVAISANGRYGFVSNHNWRDIPLPGNEPGVTPPEHLANVMTAIDLAADDLKVIDQVKCTSGVRS